MASETSLLFNGGIGRRLLNVKEAAQYLGLQVDTVYKKARLREVPFVKVGRGCGSTYERLSASLNSTQLKPLTERRIAIVNS
jgi:excisionase family DNA binding protein